MMMNELADIVVLHARQTRHTGQEGRRGVLSDPARNARGSRAGERTDADIAPARGTMKTSINVRQGIGSHHLETV